MYRCNNTVAIGESISSDKNDLPIVAGYEVGFELFVLGCLSTLCLGQKRYMYMCVN